VNRQVLDHFLIRGPSEIPYSIPASKWLRCAGKSGDSCSTAAAHSKTSGWKPLCQFPCAEGSAVARRCRAAGDGDPNVPAFTSTVLHGSIHIAFPRPQPTLRTQMAFVFLKDRSCVSLQTRSKTYSSCRPPSPMQKFLGKGGRLGFSWLCRGRVPRGDPVTQAGWCPREVSLYSQPVMKQTKVKNVVETATRCEREQGYMKSENLPF